MPILKRIVIVQENGEKKKTVLNFGVEFKTKKEFERFFTAFKNSYPTNEGERINFYQEYKSLTKNKDD
jgi:hypothetical protein